jgi:L-ascorbate metabolism protein UlaG (beta-lactamase superfamily)
MIFILVIIILAGLAVYAFVHTEPFGNISTGARRERIQQSPQYREGRFQNLRYTPDLAEDASYYSVLKEFFFRRKENPRPILPLPSVKTVLKEIDPEENVLVWMGHSSYFIQADGKKILVDPVLSGAASPISFTTKAFAGSDIYTVADLPAIDYLFISHDHWDHLDYKTVVQLRNKVGRVITGLGTGAHFERWGYSDEQILEFDWYEKAVLSEGVEVTVLPARHFSGRGFKRNQSLWVSFALQFPSMKLYLGGDSGYDDHFAQIGTTYGPFDLAVLECGQYDNNWRYIHMLPNQIMPAARDLKAEKIVPVHWSKFMLANHAWDEPVIELMKTVKENDPLVLTPMIGQKLDLKNPSGISQWWEKLS